MEYLILKIITQTASFRNPDFQNYHKSFLLPPPTTIMGIAGAALGKTPKETQEFFSQNKFTLGIYGKSEGKARDLWKYNDFQSGSIIKRDIYYRNIYYLVFKSETANIEKLKAAFENPYYALTLGNSDSLAKVKIIEDYKLEKSNFIEYALIEGDIINEVMNENFETGNEFSIYTTSDPIVYNLPVEFSYESDYGIRRVVKRKKYSFISKRMKLNIEKEGIKIKNNIFIPFISIY